MEVSKLTFTELLELFGNSSASLKFEQTGQPPEQGAVNVGVDNGGSLLVRKK